MEPLFRRRDDGRLDGVGELLDASSAHIVWVAYSAKNINLIEKGHWREVHFIFRKYW